MQYFHTATIPIQFCKYSYIFPLFTILMISPNSCTFTVVHIERAIQLGLICAHAMFWSMRCYFNFLVRYIRFAVVFFKSIFNHNLAVMYALFIRIVFCPMFFCSGLTYAAFPFCFIVLPGSEMLVLPAFNVFLFIKNLICFWILGSW